MPLLLIPPHGITLDGVTWEGGAQVDMHDQAWCRRLIAAGAVVLSGFEGFEGPAPAPDPGTLAAQQARRYYRRPG
jgi:hypothetical protein